MSIHELGEYGMDRMTDEEIGTFLASQGTAVLGLPAETGPYMLPLTYGYDGDSRLFFTYVLGSESRKERLSERADRATALVFRYDTPFHWESVFVSGPIEELPATEWDTAIDSFTGGWRPELFREADLSRGIAIYALEIDDRSGIRHTGLPPEFAASE